MVQLPLRLRKDIRDTWDKDDSPVQVQLVALQAILGLQATIQVDWEDFWASLEAGYPDKDVFVSTISSLVKMFLGCLMVKLEDSENEGWTEKFLEEVMPDGRILIVIGVTQGPIIQAKWNDRNSSISLNIPSTAHVGNIASSKAALEQDLRSLFDQPKALPVHSVTSAEQDEGWDHITGIPGRDISVKDPSSSQSVQPKSDILPAASTLPRPELLFPETLPYHIIVSKSRGSIDVQGSHSGSLELLAQYLESWTKKMENMPRRVPVVKIDLLPSLWGKETCFDCLHIEPQDNRITNLNLNPVYILAFIEGVLGYTSTHTQDGVWQYKRETKFVKS